jgi:hypothetical protein
MGFTLEPKPIFSVLVLHDKEYATLNLKPKPTPFMAFSEFRMHGVEAG